MSAKDRENMTIEQHLEALENKTVQLTKTYPRRLGGGHRTAADGDRTLHATRAWPVIGEIEPYDCVPNN